MEQVYCTLNVDSAAAWRVFSCHRKSERRVESLHVPPSSRKIMHGRSHMQVSELPGSRKEVEE